MHIISLVDNMYVKYKVRILSQSQEGTQILETPPCNCLFGKPKSPCSQPINFFFKYVTYIYYLYPHTQNKRYDASRRSVVAS